MTLRCAPVRILWSIQYTQKPEMSQNSLWILLTVSDWSILLIQCRILKRSVDASILLSEHAECAVVLDTGNCQILDSGFVIFFWMTITASVMTTDRYWWGQGQWGDNVHQLSSHFWIGRYFYSWQSYWSLTLYYLLALDQIRFFFSVTHDLHVLHSIHLSTSGLS